MDFGHACNAARIILKLHAKVNGMYRDKHFSGRSCNRPNLCRSVETVAASCIADIWGHWYKGSTAPGAANRLGKRGGPLKGGGRPKTSGRASSSRYARYP
ncbi:MAG TPA: hypothetical protein VFK31_06125 [Rhodanobacteraceae bacterium]|nr:hypothetical protein [Rhodanobacteraceae bacterium]